MTRTQPCSREEAASFGTFKLFATERRLERSGQVMKIGDRAFDILVVLVGRAAEVVTKRELMEKVWPQQIVDESSLRFHIRTLRQVLGEDRAVARYVATIAGRGYSFVAPVTCAPDRRSTPQQAAACCSPRLPPLPSRAIGRDGDIGEIARTVSDRRFVSIVGPGGIGKTTVAICVAKAMAADFDQAVHFVDFGPLQDVNLVTSTIAAALELPLDTSGLVAPLLGTLRSRRTLLVLDCCEHVLETVAPLAELIFQEAPEVHILATSRESLRVDGEHVHRLRTLACPPPKPTLSAAEALTFPAVELFVERMKASNLNHGLTDADAPAVADICRRLDGIALAIELAAGRAMAFGLQDLATLLDSRFRLLWRGNRTAVSRHQTLKATLDWSYDLLSERERILLRHLSVFVGGFSLRGVQAIAEGLDTRPDEAAMTLEDLVTKSLVIVDARDRYTLYRLPDTTRAYLQDALAEHSETANCARRHALYCIDVLREMAPEGRLGWPGEICNARSMHLDNVRAALAWSFSSTGDTAVGIALATAFAPVQLELSLLTECRSWTERALAALRGNQQTGADELELLACFAIASLLACGSTPEVLNALTSALSLAQRAGDDRSEMRILGALNIYHTRLAAFEEALLAARRYEAIVERRADTAPTQACSWLFCPAYHFKGDQYMAAVHGTASFRTSPAKSGQRLGFDEHYQMRARFAYARAMWLRGYADQALRIADSTLELAEELGHSVLLCMAQTFMVSIVLWTGDDARAEELVERTLRRAGELGLAPYHAINIGFRGEIALGRGERESGIQFLSESLAVLERIGYRLLVPNLSGALAMGLAEGGRHDEALALLDALIEHDQRRGGSFYTPEMWRIKAEVVAGGSCELYPGQEECLRHSLEWSRRQSSLVWELHAALSQARLRRQQGRIGEARQALGSVYAYFTEGHAAPVLREARELLDQLDADCEAGGPNCNYDMRTTQSL